jgi:LuxR family maltose regulon positive regulatory protein
MIQRMKMSTEGLFDRYCIPPAHPARLARPRLFQQLDEGLKPGRHLILLSAPAGSGKTTLLSEWIALHQAQKAQNGWQFCWLSLEKQDNSSRRFLLHVIAALQTLNPALGKASTALLSAPFVLGHTAPLEEILALFINELAVSRQQIVIVIEDYHLITHTRVHELLVSLLDRTPDTFRWVITSRTLPPLPLLRWRGRDQLVELNADDLRFTVEETAAYLRQLMRHEFSENALTAFHAQAGGLAAAVRLSAVILRQTSRPVERVISLTGNPALLETLVDEALHYQPQVLSHFLVQTSILKQLTGELCDAVTGEQGSAGLLAELAEQDVFLTPLDEEGRWYRYQPLFSEILRSRLAEEAEKLEGGIAALHRRASAWFEANGFLAEAIEHSLTAGDYRHAIALIERFAEKALYPAENDILLDWIQALPGELACARPRLCLIRAWGLLTAARVEEATATAQDAVQFAPAQNAEIQGEAAALRALAASPRGAAVVVPLAEQALQLLPADAGLLRGLMTLALGKAQENQDELETAAGLYRQASGIAAETGDFSLQLAALRLLGDNLMMQARLHDAEAAFQSALQAAAPAGGDIPAAGMIYNRLARLAYEWNDLTAAEEYLQKALRIGERCECADVLASALVLQALIRAVQGNIEEATRLNYQAGRYLREHIESLMTVAGVRAVQARVWVMIGRAEMAASWAESVWAERKQVATIQRELEGAAWGHVMLGRGQAEAVIQPLADLAQAAGLLGHTHSLIELLALHALGLNIMGETTRAQEIIRRALRLAEPGGYMRTFLDCGAEMARLLRQAIVPPPQQAYLNRLLEAFETAPATEESPPPPAAV